MQEELERKTVDLAVRTGKVTGRVLYRALKAYVDSQKRSATISKNSPVQGEQSVKELIGQGQGVSSMDIGDKGLRDFRKIANKYGVDFSIVKDKTGDPPKYTVFFKAKDVDAITNVLKEYSAKQVKRAKTKQKVKESVLGKLKKFKEAVAGMPGRDKEKKKERER
jgi:hypothetical protein